MTHSHFNCPVRGHNDQRLFGGGLLPFIAGAAIAAPFFANRPFFGGPFAGPFFPPFAGPFFPPFVGPFFPPFATPLPAPIWY